MTCVEVMYHQPFASPFSTYPRGSTAGAACSTGFSPGQTLSRMHHEPLDLGPTSLSSLSSPPASTSSSSSAPLSTSNCYQTPSFLLTPSSSGPPSGNTLISPSPPLLTSPIPPAPPTSSSSSPPHSSSLSSSSNHHVKDEARESETVDSEPKGAQYLTANCVLFTYANGNAGELVDDHFTKALSQGHAYNRQGEAAGNKHSNPKAPLPMSARNFPPSFWNSSYYHQHQQHQQQNHHHSVFGHHHNLHHQQAHHLPHSSSSASDMSLHSSAHYFSPALHGFSNLQTEAWGYGFSSSATGMPYSHRHMPYDFSYPSTSRFSQNYNPFLMQPSVVRPTPFGAMSGQSDVTKEHTRSSRFGDHRIGTDYTSHPSFSAIDSLQEATKDLYWF